MAAATTPAPAASASAGPRSPTASTEQRIQDLEAQLAVDPTSGQAYLDLAFALLQRVRETADPSLYGRAELALEKARGLLPDDPFVLVGTGTLELARHQFTAALATGQQALTMEPSLAPAQGVVVDALVELGRYDEAVEAAQRMVDLRPDLASLARVSYLRELHGDLPGALEAMQQAAQAGAATPENVAYITVLLGNLQSANGNRGLAERAFERALEIFPDFSPALMGQARLALGAGDMSTAIARAERAVAILPLPEYVIALGEIQEAAGDLEAARQTYELAQAETRLFEANGVVVDLELALFEADHGDPARALELARQAFADRPTIKAADALAWALFKSGDLAGAQRRSGEALRLGSLDPVLRYHAGMIAFAAGDRKDARQQLERALQVDPGFSATGRAEALEALAKLQR